MWRFTYLFFVVLLAVGFFGCDRTDDQIVGMDALSTVYVGALNGETGAYCTTLFAGQDIDAGTVCAEVIDAGDTEQLCITYTTSNGWELVETHGWVGEDLADMPQTNKGNPKVGNFPYASGDITGATTYTFCVDLNEIGTEGGAVDLCDLMLYAAAHAVVRKDNGDGTYQTETGWGDGTRLVTRGNWATYFTITLACENGGGPGGGPGTGETAFARSCEDATCFIDIPNEGINRWGWTNGPLAEGTYYFDIYAGAGQCDITKGTLVGLLTVEYDNGTATVTYNTCGTYTMDEVHLYVGNEILARNVNNEFTVAPGQYPYIDDDIATNNYTFVVNGLSGDIYVVAHAVVVGDYSQGSCAEAGCIPPEVPCAETPNTIYTTELIPDPSTYPAEQNWAVGVMREDASGGELNPWCNTLGGNGELCREGGFGVNALDGQREYILDRSGAIHDAYRMMAYDLGRAKRGFRLYTAIDHWDGSANAFVNGCCGYSASFVTADVMEYSVWGYIGPVDGDGIASAADLKNNANWELLSDPIAFDNTNTLAEGHPAYSFAGVTPAAGAPVKVYINGSAQKPGVYHAYSRDYIFCDAYRYIGVRSSTITIQVNDGDPEIDAVFGFDPVQ